MTEEHASGNTPPDVTLRAVGIVLLNLSGVGVSAIVATVFFSFRDVQDYLVRAVGRLFTKADVVEILGSSAKERLRRRLAEDSVRQAVTEVNPSLYRHLETISRGTLGNVYVSSQAWTETFSQSRIPNFRRSHLVHTYRIHSGHLATRMSFPIRLYRLSVVPEEIAEQVEKDWFDSALIVIGERRFTKADIQFKTLHEIRGSVHLAASLEQMVELTEPETDVHVESTSLVSDRDPASFFFSRYPSVGLSATVIGDPDDLYDSAWYLYCSSEQHRPAKGQATALPSGIKVETNDWLLPGEGVVVVKLAAPNNPATR